MRTCFVVALILASMLVKSEPVTYYCVAQKQLPNTKLIKVTFNKDVDILSTSSTRTFQDFKYYDDHSKVSFVVEDVKFYSETGNFDSFDAEIKTMKKYAGYGIALKYVGCLKFSNEKLKFILGEIYDYLSSENMKKEFPKFEAIKKIFIFLQIANKIQTLHSLNAVHYLIEPRNIVFINEEKTDIALINFSQLKEKEKETSQFNPNSDFNAHKVFLEKDEIKKNFVHDTFAFVLTMINMLNSNNTFSELMKISDTPYESFSNSFKLLYLKSANKDEQLTKFIKYIENILFVKKSEDLSITNIIAKLIETFNSLANQTTSKDMTTRVLGIAKESSDSALVINLRYTVNQYKEVKQIKI